MVKLKQFLNYSTSVLKSGLLNKQTFLFVFFSVTNRCNLQCEYCKISKRRAEEMPTKKVFNLFDKLKAYGTKRITFCGGEPLIREDISRLIDYAKKDGFYTSLISNGTLVKEKIEEIKNLDMIQLSFDGRKKNHELNRGKGSYDKLMESFKILREHSVSVATSTVLNKHNINDIDFILKKSEEFDFLVYFNPLLNLPELTGNTENLEIEREKYKEVLRNIINKKRFNDKIVNSNAYLGYLLKSLERGKSEKSMKCFAGKLFCHIEPDGSIYPCTNLIGNQKYKCDLGEQFKIDKDVLICKSCVTYGFNEINLVCSFNLNSILNSFRFL